MQRITSRGLDAVVQYIRDARANSVLVLTGAGLSTASGVPDFRSPETGIYARLQSCGLSDPQLAFAMDYFLENPKPFYEISKDVFPTGTHRPNAAHYFIRLLAEKGKLSRVYTQNIDALERMAGIPMNKLIEAHGNYFGAECTKCHVRVPVTLFRDAILKNEIAHCPDCNGIIKPDVVFFGEQLPQAFYGFQTDVRRADVVLILGTSLKVSPFNGVVDAIPKRTPRVLFNRSPTGPFANPRKGDIVIMGDIVESIMETARRLDWETDLRALMASEIILPQFSLPEPEQEEEDAEERPEDNNNKSTEDQSGSGLLDQIMNRLRRFNLTDSRLAGYQLPVSKCLAFLLNKPSLDFSRWSSIRPKHTDR